MKERVLILIKYVMNSKFKYICFSGLYNNLFEAPHKGTQRDILKKLIVLDKQLNSKGYI
jgi:hypothetical protein